MQRRSENLQLRKRRDVFANDRELVISIAPLVPAIGRKQKLDKSEISCLTRRNRDSRRTRTRREREIANPLDQGSRLFFKVQPARNAADNADLSHSYSPRLKNTSICFLARSTRWAKNKFVILIILTN